MEKGVIIGGNWNILNKKYEGDLIFNKSSGGILLDIYYNNPKEFLAWSDKPTEITEITGYINQKMKCILTDCKVIKRHSTYPSRHHIVIHAKTFFADANFSDHEKIFNEWKSKYSLSKNEKKKQREMNTVHSEEITIDWLIHQIISYPIEKKTLIDNTYFLSHIRESAIKVLKSEYKTNS